MARLNRQALKLLTRELDRQVQLDPALAMGRDLVLRRWDRLLERDGEPATLAELQASVKDLFPNFSDRVLERAAAANRPSFFGKLVGPLVTLGVIGVGVPGFIWLVNLPYPMIRWPVARTAPILLLPSFMQMDHSYRQTVSLVEQADQLVNQATGPADIELGAEKVKAAQSHLDKLPVWFLGYYPQRYCSLFSCGWQFTLDEFRGARASIGRMEAKVFQEQQAAAALEEGTGAIAQAQQAYQQAGDLSTKTSAIAAWQAAIDSVHQVPAATLAGRMAKTQLIAYERDFQQVATLAGANSKADRLISAAKAFGMEAATLAQNPPHTADEWQAIAELWAQAIANLDRVSQEDPGYETVPPLKAKYATNQVQVKTRLAAERDSVAAYDQAQSAYQNLLRSLPDDGKVTNRNQAIAQIAEIRRYLVKVQPGTTVYTEAQAMQQFADKKLKDLGQ